MFSWMSLSHAITIFNWIYATPFQKHSAQRKCVFCICRIQTELGHGLCVDRSDSWCYNDLNIHIYVDKFYHNFLIICTFSLEMCANFGKKLQRRENLQEKHLWSSRQYWMESGKIWNEHCQRIIKDTRIWNTNYLNCENGFLSCFAIERRRNIAN